jgi:hypothetical protein
MKSRQKEFAGRAFENGDHKNPAGIL